MCIHIHICVHIHSRCLTGNGCIGNKHFNDEYFGSEWPLEPNSLSSHPGLALASSVVLGKLFKPLCDGLSIKWG